MVLDESINISPCVLYGDAGKSGAWEEGPAADCPNLNTWDGEALSLSLELI